jgi:hypothetical protein
MNKHVDQALLSLATEIYDSGMMQNYYLSIFNAGEK